MLLLLLVFIFFVQIEFLSCIFENKNERDLFHEINHQRQKLGLRHLDRHLILQLAAEKRCSNRKQLIEAYQRMISNRYTDEDWPRQEHLNQIFADVSETIDLNGSDIREEIFHQSLLIPNIYRRDFLYIGIGIHHDRNLSARCILYGSSNRSVSHHRRRLRLLYILIACGIFLLSLIICSVINDRRRARLEQDMLNNGQTIIPKKSMAVFIDKDRKSSSRRGDMNRLTMARLGSMIDERPSAVHSFSQDPK